MVRGPVKIFVASPGDVKAEREICRKLIKEWKDGKIFDIESFFWEDDALPGFGSYTQEVISKQSLQADRNGSEFDIVIVMVWSRLGTETKYFLSGTAEELIIALLNSYPSPTRVMLYCSDVPIKPSRIVPEQLAGVNSLRSCCKDAGGLLFPYESVKKFDRLIKTQLARAIRERNSPDIATSDDLSRRNRRIRRKATDEFADVLKGIVRRLAACESRIENNRKACLSLIRRCAEYFASFNARKIQNVQEHLRANLANFCNAIDREFKFSINRDDIELFFQAKIVLAFAPVQSATIASLRNEFIQALTSAISKAQDYKTVIVEMSKLINNRWPKNIHVIPKHCILNRIQEEDQIFDEIENITRTISELLKRKNGVPTQGPAARSA